MTTYEFGDKDYAMRQTIKARYHDGVLQPLEPLTLADDTEVQITVETASSAGAEEVLRRTAQVEAIAVDRQRFSGTIACR